MCFDKTSQIHIFIRVFKYHYSIFNTYNDRYEFIPEDHIIMSMIRIKNTLYDGKLLLITEDILKEYNIKIFSYTTTRSLRSPSYNSCNSQVFSLFKN